LRAAGARVVTGRSVRSRIDAGVGSAVEASVGAAVRDGSVVVATSGSEKQKSERGDRVFHGDLVGHASAHDGAAADDGSIGEDERANVGWKGKPVAVAEAVTASRPTRRRAASESERRLVGRGFLYEEAVQ
jgi:hypothetical protein